MKLSALVELSAWVASTRSRTRKLEAIAEMLGSLAGEDLEIATAFMTGALRQGRIGLGPAALREAATIDAAAESSLELGEVDAAFVAIAGESGSGSKQRRLDRTRELFGRATAGEQTFLAKLVYGELRQGALAGLMAEAVARAAGLPAATVRRALMLCGDLTEVSRVALTEGEAGLARFRLELFRPIQPMLAQPSEDLAAALEKLGEAALETKLDGARIQVHRREDEVRVYSRRLNEVTTAVPEVVELARTLPATQLVLDGEVLALKEDGKPWPFQETMKRFGRRLDVERMREQLPLSVFFFDLMQLDGEDWLERPGRERFARLRELTGATVPQLVTADSAEARDFLQRAYDQGHEGVMAKSLDAGYEAGSRGAAWFKIKPVHTLDLVVLAAEWGSGRRKGWLSNLHLGAVDPAGGFVMLGKTFKGMTDKVLAWQTEALLARELRRDEWTVHVRPELVVEIAFSDIQQSPHYPGGMALRFARLRGYREDKAVADADTIDTVRRMFEAARR